MRYLISLLIAFTLTSCAANPPPEVPPVSGGETCEVTRVSQEPAVALLFNMYEGSLCTGSLVTPDTIVTAAHCVTASPVPTTVVNFTNADETRLAYAVHIDEVFDFAAMTLDSPVDIPPLEVAESLRVGDAVTIHGHGCVKDKTIVNEVPESNGPYKRWLEVVTAESYVTIVDGCACNGDSGSPVLNTHGELVSVAHSILTGNSGKPGVVFGTPLDTIRRLLVP